MCVSVYAYEGVRTFGGLQGPPEQSGLSPGLLKLLATVGGEVIPGQGLHLVGAGVQGDSLSETAARAGLPVK